jgi:NAD(P)-dependent dehydrogenase (short-subunit alcohol dehydrogenase family)
VKKLLERSNKVIATARVPQEAQQLHELAAENSNLTVAALDVSQPDSIQAFAAEVKRHTQHVDVSEPLESLLPLQHDST